MEEEELSVAPKAVKDIKDTAETANRSQNRWENEHQDILEEPISRNHQVRGKSLPENSKIHHFWQNWTRN